MDLADASLVWAAETTGIIRVLTTDRADFSVYRTRIWRALEVLNRRWARSLADLPDQLCGRVIRLAVEVRVLIKDNPPIQARAGGIAFSYLPSATS